MRLNVLSAGMLTLGLQVAVPLALAGAVFAQEPPASGADPPAAVPAPVPVDVARLPIDLGRLQRRLRAAAERTEADGLNLKYFVDVYAPAPPVTFFTPQDNLTSGPVPNSAPTHAQMLEALTPQELRASGLVRSGGVQVLGRRKKR